jgi:hypothetical protein
MGILTVVLVAHREPVLDHLLHLILISYNQTSAIGTGTEIEIAAM